MSQAARTPDSQPARLTDRKRNSIVQAAVSQFQSRGYYAASMNAIAEQAEVSKRTLYNHFESKEALFDAIVEELFCRVNRMPVCEFDGEQDLASQLTRLAETEVDFMTSDAVQMLARAGLSRVLAEPEVGRTIGHRQLQDRVARWLKQAYEAGNLKELDVEFAAHQFLGLLRSFAFWPLIVHGEPKPSKKKRRQIIDSTVAMFLAQYGV